MIKKTLPQNWLPTGHWEEASRGQNKSNRWVKIAHVDPWPLGNQEFIHPKSIQEDETHTITIVCSERRSWQGGGTAGAQLEGAQRVAELAEEMGRVLG